MYSCRERERERRRWKGALVSLAVNPDVGTLPQIQLCIPPHPLLNILVLPGQER